MTTEEKIKLIVCSLTTKNFQWVSNFTFERNKRYAEQHNLIFQTEILENLERPPSWYKIKSIKKAFELPCEWVMWIDADAVFYNFKKSILDFIHENKDIVLSRDDNGFNCGVMLWRNCNENKILLDAMWEQREFIDHCWWEQAAFMKLEKENFMDLQNRIGVAPKSLFNAYESDFCASSAVVHVPGNGEHKMTVLAKILSNQPTL